MTPPHPRHGSGDASPDPDTGDGDDGRRAANSQRAAEAIYGGGPRPGNTSTVKKLKKDDT